MWEYVPEPARSRGGSSAELVLKRPRAIRRDRGSGRFVAIFRGFANLESHLFSPRACKDLFQPKENIHFEDEIPDVASRLVGAGGISVELQTIDVRHGIAFPVLNPQSPVASADKVTRTFVARVFSRYIWHRRVFLGNLAFASGESLPRGAAGAFPAGRVKGVYLIFFTACAFFSGDRVSLENLFSLTTLLYASLRVRI